MLVGGSQDESHSDVATGRSAISRCSLLAGRFRISILPHVSFSIEGESRSGFKMKKDR